MMTSLSSETFYENKKYILEEIGSEQVFMMTGDFKDIDIKKKYYNKLRTVRDKKPNCFFTYWRGKLMFNDYTYFHKKSVDCIDYISIKYNLNLVDAVQFIIDNCVPNGIKKEILTQHKQPNLRVKEAEWDERHEKFWGVGGLQIKDIKEVTPIKEYSLYGVTKIHGTIGFKISLEEGDILYHPYERKNKWKKFISSDVIGNIRNISYKGKFLFVTKSYKDSKIIEKFLCKNVVWLQSENHIPNKDILYDWLHRFHLIYVFFDNDSPGIRLGEKLVRVINDIPISTNNCQLFHIPLKYKEKDPFDFVSKYGVEEFKELTKDLIW